jgi:hypothetical protein
MPQQLPYDPNVIGAEGLGSWIFGQHLGDPGQGISGHGFQNDD